MDMKGDSLTAYLAKYLEDKIIESVTVDYLTIPEADTLQKWIEEFYKDLV